MLGIKLDSVLLAYAVKDVPDGGFQGLKGGVGFRPEPFVLDFAPERLNFIGWGL